MADERQNCWDFWKCKVRDRCPAHPRKGTMCYTIAGTLCHGEKQGVYAEKIENCRKCGYYQGVLFGKGVSCQTK